MNIEEAKKLIGKKVRAIDLGICTLSYVDGRGESTPFLVVKDEGCCCMSKWVSDIKALPEKLEYVHFDNTNDLIEYWNDKNGFNTESGLQKPSIWLKLKDIPTDIGHIITDYINDRQVVVNGEDCYMDKLFANYVFLDGSPCGKIKE